MTRELSSGRISMRDLAFMRSQLKLRFNVRQNSWEVWTTIHGTHTYRWFFITTSKKQWYQIHFPEIIIEEDYHD